MKREYNSQYKTSFILNVRGLCHVVLVKIRPDYIYFPCKELCLKTFILTNQMEW